MKNIDDLKKFTRTTKKDYCQCLYEIENKLPRTKFCFAPCPDQRRILENRNKNK